MTARVDPVSRPSSPPSNVPTVARSPRLAVVRGLPVWATFALLWITVAVFASPAAGAGIGSFATPVLHPTAPLAVLGAPLPGGAPAAGVRDAASTVTVPGNDPKGQEFQSGPQLESTLLQNRSFALQNWSLVASDPSAAAAQLRSKLLGPGSESYTRCCAAPPPAPPAVASPTVPVGTVAGVVAESTTLAGLGGVAIQAYSASGQSDCPVKTCSQVTSAANGSFSVTAPVGADYVQLTLAFNLTNISYATVFQGLTTNVGTVYMVPEVVLTGIVEVNTSAHPKLPGTAVTSVSDDDAIVGTPAGASNSEGAFTAGMPPAPSTVTFLPPFGYESTFLFENGAPGQHLDIGIVYIQKDPVVEAHFYDAVTREPISGTCTYLEPDQCNAVTVCSAITPSECGQQGAATGSSAVIGVGPAGNDFIKAWATGYETDTVFLGYVGYNAPTFNAGNIYLTPMGVGRMTVDLTHNISTPLPKDWTIGEVYVSICSLNGLNFGDPVVNLVQGTVNVTATGCNGGCAAPLTPFEFASLPLRILIRVTPDSLGSCGPTPLWPIPSDLPVYGNQTWINITPDEVTTFSSNLSVGSYVAGNVSTPGGAVPSDFTVTPVAIDDPVYASYPFLSSSGSTLPCSSKFAWANDPGAFCVAVPPGASELLVQTPSSPYEENFTWGSAPNMCCSGSYPMTLSQYTTDHATTIDLNALGAVHGNVAQAGTGQGVFYASYAIGAGGTNSVAPSFDGAVALNGTIVSPAPLGWDSVTISASGFAPNTVWVNVSGNDSFGTVDLTPLATVAGRVVDPNGVGILGANVYYCSIVQTLTCSQPLGAGLATTGGGYNGTVPGLWLPYSTDEIYAVASGYTSDWTWVNATAGQVTIAPTLVLYPSTEAAHPMASDPARPGPANPLPETYLRGYLIDNSTGEGLSTGGGYIQACSTATGACYSLAPGSNSQGLFNATVPLGSYELTANPPGYQPVTRFVNASYGALHYLGVIELVPLPWVTGHVAILPFGNISIVDPVTGSVVLVATMTAATALACDANSSVCGAALQIASNGSFTVQAPAGTYDRLQILPLGGAAGPSANGGFASNSSTFNASVNSTTVLGTTIGLPIYVMIGGTVVDNTTTGPGGISPWLFVPGAATSISTFGPSHTTINGATNLGGEYLAIVPPNTLNLVAATSTVTGVFTSDSTSVSAALPETDPPTVFQLPPMGLVHFGWVQAQVLTPSGVPAQFLSAATELTVGISSATYTGIGETNAWGQLNVTAPPGIGVAVVLGPANDYNTSFATVDVNASSTSYVFGGDAAEPGVMFAAPWGWAISTAVNSTYSPVRETILDQVHQLALPGAVVTVASSDPSYAGSRATSNAQGQYVADAPIGTADTLSVARTAAVTNTTHLSVAAGEVLVQSTMNLTGVGVLAGEVVAYPSGLPVPGATVESCPILAGGAVGSSNCYSATTNASGNYWVAAYPGQVSIDTTAYGYVENGSTAALACSDCWTPLGPISLGEFAFIVGSVRGLPSGLPLAGANVSLCVPVGGNPVGACDFTVAADPSGNFVLEAPAGSYNLLVNSSGFNTSNPLPVTLQAGQVLPIGTVFLQQFGSARGTVGSEATLLPVGDASVYACESWAGGSCLPTISADASGAFVLFGPPGSYTLTVAAPGYLVYFGSATVTAGTTSQLAEILLAPQGTETYYEISGVVRTAGTSVEPLAGATVIAEVGGAPAFTGTTDANGAFAFNVLSGTYDLVAAAPGYAPASETIVADAPLAGIVFSLPVMTYLFSSYVIDGLSGSPLQEVTISENGIVLGATDVAGAVAFPLANGTHDLLAADPASTSVEYAPVTFVVAVAGAPVVHNLQLDPPSELVRGVIVDADSGVALPGVPVTVRGIAVDGVAVAQQATTGAAGSFSFVLPSGLYNASASVTGYGFAKTAFSVTTAGPTLTIFLTPLASPSTGQAPSGSGAEWTLIGIAGLVVAAAALGGALAVTWRRPTRPPTARRP
jgi:hypothetical protein